MKSIISFVVLTLLFSGLFGQNNEPNISVYLDMINNGQISEVKEKIPQLKLDYPNSAAIILLEALTTDDGNEAMEYYLKLLDSTYQNDKYYDIACYKMFQYYYSTNNYAASDKYAKILLRDFPNSQYTNMISPMSKTEVKKEVKETINEERSPVKYKTEEKQPEGTFTVQIGAFAEKKNADALKSKLIGYKSVRVVEQVVRGRIFFVVLVGEFSNKEDAIEYNIKLQKEMNLNKGVVINNDREIF